MSKIFLPGFRVYAAILTCISALSMQASTLYTSPFTDAMTAPGYNASFVGRTDANSFSLSSAATLQSVSVYALDCCGFAWSGTITYTLFTNASYEPSDTPFASGSTSSYIATTVYSDSATNKVTDYEFNLTTPVALDANTTYWLGIDLSSPAGGDESGWNSCYNCGGINAGSGSNAAPYSWGLNSGTGAFQLFDTNFQTTPEPGSAEMFALGLMLARVGCWHRRRGVKMVAR